MHGTSFPGLTDHEWSLYHKKDVLVEGFSNYYEKGALEEDPLDTDIVSRFLRTRDFIVSCTRNRYILHLSKYSEEKVNY